MTAVVACGALAGHVSEICARRGWSVEVHAIDPLLHNRPNQIPSAVRAAVQELRTRHHEVALAYADCGTYGALATQAQELAVPLLRGDHCYDIFATQSRLRQLQEQEPGTYFLTDFLVRTFASTVISGLGLDAHPELLGDYFGNYRRVIWLKQSKSADLDQLAQQAAEFLGLPLEVEWVGEAHLEQQLAQLIGEGA